MPFVAERIEKKLKEKFKPTHLKVIDESFRHDVPAGSETHFKVVIISDKFSDQVFTTRHREIYSLLAQEFEEGLRALVLHTHTQKEWKDLQYTVAASPPCRNDGRPFDLKEL
ncbi:transcriptional regulator BolA [Candidatus Fukatsuia symbiotica]|uniref:BolA family transcriptional regulator n=2 Tax=Yersiniaceae TaxID=1903411 RepID=A0A2U8I505_9GAMM|nr:transcriptional regulator BolA [Candidatus Fukatsuia symbiotica]AWK14241.1 BolA family transcriptional regulator [Candidatus Fukatsuia symbiotica]MEA9444486.1 transcriptional regulator BolA [Candidatus Fukatsuia symbiotica]